MGRPKTPTRRLKCQECGIEFDTARGAHFCCPEHKRDFHRRAEAEGRAIVALAKAWALGRGGGHTPANPTSRVAMRELTQILREFNDADREAGRMSAIDYVDLLQKNGSRHFDRRRT